MGTAEGLAKSNAESCGHRRRCCRRLGPNCTSRTAGVEEHQLPCFLQALSFFSRLLGRRWMPLVDAVDADTRGADKSAEDTSPFCRKCSPSPSFMTKGRRCWSMPKQPRERDRGSGSGVGRGCPRACAAAGCKSNKQQVPSASLLVPGCCIAAVGCATYVLFWCGSSRGPRAPAPPARPPAPAVPPHVRLMYPALPAAPSGGARRPKIRKRRPGLR
jgi:hypothetical protein